MNLFDTKLANNFRRFYREPTCQGPVKRTTCSLPCTSTSARSLARLFRYWSATSSNAPIPTGNGYHFMGVFFQASDSRPGCFVEVNNTSWTRQGATHGAKAALLLLVASNIDDYILKLTAAVLFSSPQRILSSPSSDR